MAASTFLIIGMVGLVLLAVSAMLGSDDADLDMDMDVDLDLDIDVDADTDIDTDTSGSGGGGGGGILEWVSIKALAVGAVGFGFVGWATTTNNSAAFIVWTASIITGLALWIMAVKLLFPWLKTQQGDDLQTLDAYEGLMADVVVRIPTNGLGTVQFPDPSGSVIRRNARSVRKDQEVAAGKRVLIVLSKPEHVVVDDDFSLIQDLDNN